MVLSAGASPKSPLRLGIPARPTTHNRSAHEKIPRSPHSAHHGTSRSVPTETHWTAAVAPTAEQSRDGSLIDRSPIDAQEPSLACSLPNRATNQSLTHPRPGPAYTLSQVPPLARRRSGRGLPGCTAVMATSSTLGQTQRYAAGALLALALRQAQTHQTVLLGSHGLDDEPHPDAATAVEPDARDLWTHESRGLLRPVLR